MKPESSHQPSIDMALRECAAEAIHLPGAIQPFGCLLVLDTQHRIVQLGGDILQTFGVEPGALLGQPVNRILDLPIGQLPTTSTVREFGASVTGADPSRRLHGLAHHHDGLTLVELIAPQACYFLHDPDREPRGMAAISPLQQAAAALGEKSIDAYCQTVVNPLAEAIDYDRVLIYRFDPHWNGQVIAEANRGPGEPYLGQWYPATDIPPQARDLYTRNKIRVLVDVLAESQPLEPLLNPVTGRPLDLSYALLRSFSSVHREYLTNMGVRSTLVVSIVVAGQLWGLLACHHSTPRLPGPDLRGLTATMADLIAAQVSFLESRQRLQGSLRAKECLHSFPARIRDCEDWASALIAPESGLLELIEADGITIVRGPEVFCRGLQLPSEKLRGLVARLENQSDSILMTNALCTLGPEFADVADTVGGVIATLVPGATDSAILWFRRPIAQTVTWAGDPRKGMDRTSDAARLHPRTSFAAWLETVSGRGRGDWTISEQAAVTEVVRVSLLDVLVTWHRKQSERLWDFQGILSEQVGEAVIVTDRAGTVTFWNEGATRIFGWTAEEMLGQHITCRYSDERRVEVGDLLAGIFAGAEFRGEWQDTRKDGRPVWIDAAVRSIRGPRGEIVGTISISHDITVRKEAEAAVRRSEARYRLLAENSSDLITLCEGGLVSYISPACRRLLEREAIDLIGQPWVALADPEDRAVVVRFEELLEATPRKEQVAIFRMIRADGSRVWVESKGMVVRSTDLTRTMVQVITRDIDERMQLEAQLREAQKIEAVGQLAGGVAHDFNNLLTVINSYALMVLEDLPPNAPSRELLECVLAAGEQGAALTGQLLTFTRKKALQIRNLDLNEVFTSTTRMLRRMLNEDIELSTCFESDLGIIRADASQLGQILMNLVVNARDAMPSGGKLEITTANVEIPSGGLPEGPPEIPPGAYVLLRVSDTGCGMSQEVQTRLFQPFFTTKQGGRGTGLGMSIVLNCVRQFDGFIRIDSAPDLGTSCSIYFPRRPDTEGKSRTVTVSGTPKGGNEVVLVVEDNEDVLGVTTRVLVTWGYRVYTARSGMEAIERARSMKGGIDLLLTDLVMPGMSGIELARRLSELYPSLRCLFVSGYADTAAAQLGAAQSGSRFLQKPFVPTDLARYIRETLDSVPDSPG